VGGDAGAHGAGAEDSDFIDALQHVISDSPYRSITINIENSRALLWIRCQNPAIATHDFHIILPAPAAIARHSTALISAQGRFDAVDPWLGRRFYLEPLRRTFS
jgi:hypothetical protein